MIKLENKIEKLSLIEGCFDANEANEILTNIYLTKLNFHKIKNFSSQERLGKDDSTAVKRIPELKLNMEKLSEIISEARLQNRKLVITSEIKIKFLEE